MKKTKLPKKFKAKWLEALRGGEFKQGAGQLYSPDDGSYCCLGVACRVAGKSLNDITGSFILGNIKKGVPKVLHYNPEMFMDAPTRLAEMNDNGSRSFDEIADYIEINL